MLPPASSNQPARKREEKGRRKEGKSQCRRGGTQKSRLVAMVVPIPSAVPPSSKSAHSSAPTIASPIALPTGAAIVSVPLPIIGGSHHKDPHAVSPSVPVREGKAIRRKAKEKEKEKEKEPAKMSTVRQKKHSATQSVSIEAKCSSETDGSKNVSGSKNEKKKKSSSSDMENKSDGSKEPSENEDKVKINKDLAKNFFRHIIESQRARKRSDDARLETMPESSQINLSARALRKKTKKQPKTELDTNFFKPNGEPVWVVPEGVEEKTEDGTVIKNPELVKAMAEEEMEMDEKDWFDLVMTYMGIGPPGVTLTNGLCIPADYKFDPFAPEDELDTRNQYVSGETVLYNTVKNIVDLSEDAIRRFATKRNMDERRPSAPPVPSAPVAPPDTPESVMNTIPPAQTASQELYPPKPHGGVSFRLNTLTCARYDRHHAIASIQKFRKKSTFSLEQSTQAESKEKA